MKDQDDIEDDSADRQPASPFHREHQSHVINFPINASPPGMIGTPSLAEQRTGQVQGLGRWSLSHRSEMVSISGFLRLVHWVLTGSPYFRSVLGRRLRAFEFESRRVIPWMYRVCYTHRSRPKLLGHAAGRIPSTGGLRDMACLDCNETCDRVGGNSTSGQEAEQTSPWSLATSGTLDRRGPPLVSMGDWTSKTSR